MEKRDIIATLGEIALLLELKGENVFKVRAYTNAARALAGMDEDIVALIESGELGQRKGFGKALVAKLGELVGTGKLEYLEELRSEFPPSLLELIEIPGLGPKKIKLFYDELGVDSVDKLEAGCRDGSVAELPGCGEKTAEKLLAGIARRREYASLFLYAEARLAADQLLADLVQLPELNRIEVAGSLRRYKEITKDLDLIGATDKPQAVMDAFVALPAVKEVVAQGETKSTVILESGIQADLRLVPDETYPFALHHFTGSKDHNVAMRGRALKRGQKISEWGLFDTTEGERLIPCRDEAEFFDQLGLRFIPPELREDMGEIERAEEHDFPRLVEPSDYRGSLHCHTHASDGAGSIEELAAYAHGLGHRFLGITDHSRSSFQADGLDDERLLSQVERIKIVRQGLPSDFTLFAGVECDIMPDGRLDYEDDVLEQLDYVIIAVHSAFSRPEDKMTQRVVRAIEHPCSRILAHPTGRLLLRRDAYAIDMDRIIDAAAANNVVIELNCHPRRLDMDWRLWRRARAKGVLCSLDADVHAVEGFAHLEQGVGFCRKGWLRAEDVVNCWEPERLVELFGGVDQK